MIFPESHLRWKLSDYVMRFVAEQGVKHVFLVVGGGAMHLNKSLADEKRLVPVCNLHEQASAVAAENYSKATNDLGAWSQQDPAQPTRSPGSPERGSDAQCPIFIFSLGASYRLDDAH